MKLFRSKTIPAPSEIDVELVEALQVATDCIEEHGVCREAAQEGREVLERARAELGLRP